MQRIIHSAAGRGTVLALAVFCGAGPGAAQGRKQIEAGVRASYPLALASWATGDDAAALDRLVEMERGLTAPDFEPAAIDDLWKAKLGVVRDLLGAVGDDVLVPVMLLHHDAYLEYRRRGEPILARHSRVMAEELAMVYAERSEEPAARGVAAALLTSLGGHLQQGWSWKRSAELFNLATEIDPASGAAHLGLGALYERRTELDLAVEHFRKATAIDSGNVEARLRLGVCLRRQGDHAGARLELSQLVGAGGPDWIDVVASQELAALIADQGGDPEAMLRAARDRHPGSSRLAVQLGRWLDSRGRGREAAGLLEDAFLRSEPEPESPRYQYNRWPAAALEDVRATLRREAAGQRPLLASGVQNLSVQGAP